MLPLLPALCFCRDIISFDLKQLLVDGLFELGHFVVGLGHGFGAGVDVGFYFGLGA